MINSKLLHLETFAAVSYHKCECCSRVRDIYFRLNVRHAQAEDMLVGSFELCKDCGKNMGDILHTQVDTERTLTDFTFE